MATEAELRAEARDAMHGVKPVPFDGLPDALEHFESYGDVGGQEGAAHELHAGRHGGEDTQNECNNEIEFHDKLRALRDLHRA